MPVNVAGAAGGGLSEVEMARAIEAAGVNGNLQRALLEKYSSAQIYRALQKGHTAQSLADLLSEAQAAAAPVKVTPAKVTPAATTGDTTVAVTDGWWDAALAAGGWTFLVGLVWLLNGLGTIVSVVGGVTNTLPATLSISLNPFVAWGLALGVAGITYLRLASDPNRSLWVLVPALVGAGAGTAFVLTRPVTPTLLGCVLGIIVHLTISKTELLYWGALFSWRVFPLIGSMAADVLTSAQGLITLAYRMEWTWVLGGDPEAQLPGNVLMWFRPIGIMWQRFRSAGVPADQLPAMPDWWGRAVIILIVVSVVALGAERIFRLVWRDWTTTWAARPWRRVSA